jgi:hypothetical protein
MPPCPFNDYLATLFGLSSFRNTTPDPLEPVNELEACVVLGPFCLSGAATLTMGFSQKSAGAFRRTEENRVAAGTTDSTAIQQKKVTTVEAI